MTIHIGFTPIDTKICVDRSFGVHAVENVTPDNEIVENSAAGNRGSVV